MNTTVIAVRTDKGEPQLHHLTNAGRPFDYDALCALVREQLPDAKTILVEVKP